MKIRVICFPKKLLGVLAVMTCVLIFIQIYRHGFGNSTEVIDTKKHVADSIRNDLGYYAKYGNLEPIGMSKIRNKINETNVLKISLNYTSNVDPMVVRMPQVGADGIGADDIPKYDRVTPDFLQIDTCPACFGTSLCDQFETGQITIDTETDSLAKIKNVYFGFWDGYNLLEHHVPVVVKRLVNDGELLAFEKYLQCNVTASDSQEMRQGPLLSPEVHNSDPTHKRRMTCDVGEKIMVTSLASPGIFNVDSVRKVFYKIAHNNPTALGLAMCASQRLLDNITGMYRNFDKVSDYSPEAAMLATSFVLNPEGVVTKFCHRYLPELSKYFPKYYGECGRMIVVQPGGSPLEKTLSDNWQVRVDIAWQILQMVDDFLTSNPDWLIFFVDIRFDNFCVTDHGQLQLIDLEDIMIVDRDEIKQKRHDVLPKDAPCNVDCLLHIAQSIYSDNSNQCDKMADFAAPVMHMLMCQRLISNLDSTKYIKMFDRSRSREHDRPDGLLHDIPSALEPKLSELLYECVFESQPGSRLDAVKQLKSILEAVRRSNE